jgi:hypothetical protein
MTLDEYFKGNEHSRITFDCLHEMITSLGPAEMRIQQSQIAFLRKLPFAYITMPLKHQQGKGTPLILSVSLRHQEPSSRWKKIVQLPTKWFTHYLELYSPSEVDDQVCSWLQEAWNQAA